MAVVLVAGHRDRDWTAFAAVYQKVTGQLRASPEQRQELGAATMTAMIASLHDNHARWSYPAPPPGSVPGDLGIMTSPAYPLAVVAPQEALPPLFVTMVLPGSPAASGGLRPGDVIVSVNGAPPFADGIISEGVMNLLFGPYPQPGRVSVQLHRPAIGRTWTVTLTPAIYQATPPPVSAKLLDGDIAYVQLPGFFDGAADQVLQAITNRATGTGSCQPSAFRWAGRPWLTGTRSFPQQPSGPGAINGVRRACAYGVIADMEDQSPWMPGASPRREVAVPLHLHAVERRKGQRR